MKDIENEIIQMEERFRKAQLTNNTNELDQLISDDLICTFIDGLLYTKQQDLDIHKSGTLKFESITPLEQKIKILGDTAVVNVLMDIKGKSSEERIDGKVRYTRVWAKDKGFWKIAVVHIGLVK